jgi:glycosyltransferase involved in cell wall biosynthesis
MNSDLTVIIPTYNRAHMLKRTIELMQENLIYDRGDVNFLVGVDGDDDTPNVLREMEGVRMVQGPKEGLGANLNLLINLTDTDLIFQMDDDHHLVKPLDINEHAWNLLSEPLFGWIRLMFGVCSGFEGYYHFTAQLHGKYWKLLPGTTEPYIPSNRPHLKKKDFHTHCYGLYTPGLKLGETEIDFCRHFSETYEEGKTPDVFMPMYPPPESTWRHVGDSWQKEGF